MLTIYCPPVQSRSLSVSFFQCTAVQGSRKRKKFHILCYGHGTNEMLSKYFASKSSTHECNGEVTCGSYDSLMFTHGYHYYIAICKKYGFVPGIIFAFISIIYLEIANKSIRFAMGFSLLANWLLTCFFMYFSFFILCRKWTVMPLSTVGDQSLNYINTTSFWDVQKIWERFIWWTDLTCSLNLIIHFPNLF